MFNDFLPYLIGIVFILLIMIFSKRNGFIFGLILAIFGSFIIVISSKVYIEEANTTFMKAYQDFVGMLSQTIYLPIIEFTSTFLSGEILEKFSASFVTFENIDGIYISVGIILVFFIISSFFRRIRKSKIERMNLAVMRRKNQQEALYKMAEREKKKNRR